MNKVTDDLLGLFSICEGAVTIHGNPHRCGNEAVVQWISGYCDRDKIPTAEKVEMIEAGSVVVISYYLDRFGSPFEVYGATVKQAAFRAFELAKQTLGKDTFVFEKRDNNVTDMADELISVCLNEVYINYNEFKTNDWGFSLDHGKDRTVADWFAFEKEITPDNFMEDVGGDIPFPPALVNQIIQANTLFDVHFYPTGSVGFYHMIYSDPTVLDHAVVLAKKDVERWNLLNHKDTAPVADSSFGTPVMVTSEGFSLESLVVKEGWKP